MFRFVLMLVTMFSGFPLSSDANAGLIYQFTDSVGTVTSDFHVRVGQSVVINVYLAETAGTGFLSDDLLSAGLRIESSLSGIAEVKSVGDIVPNPAFTDFIDIPNPSALSAEFSGVAFTTPLVPDISNRILLGSFRYTGLTQGIVTLAAIDRDLNTDETISGSFLALDSLISSNTADVTVEAIQAVPEPSTLFSFALGIGILFAQRRSATSKRCLPSR